MKETLGAIAVVALVLAIMLSVGAVFGQGFDAKDIVPASQRVRFRNPDGSCVQCSIAIAGVHHINANAESLLWNSDYGPAVRGGSGSERVKAYAASRGLDAWVITENTQAWIEWALSTNRYAALSFDYYHFQTAVGMDDDKQTFYVVDNNSPERVQKVPRADFIARHSWGQWCVILKGPAPPPWIAPALVNWLPKKKKGATDAIPIRSLGFDSSLF